MNFRAFRTGRQTSADSSSEILTIPRTANFSCAGSSTERFVRFSGCTARGRTNQNELWSYGPEAQTILTAYDRLRYRLMPYIYSLAWKTTSEAYTPMRALAMDFRTDTRALNVGDQFMFGPALLVNPVTEPGATSRRVYLPKSKWYDFWTGHEVDGGGDDRSSGADRSIPLFVRGGSIVPHGARPGVCDPETRRSHRAAGISGRRREFHALRRRKRQLQLRKGSPRHDSNRLGRSGAKTDDSANARDNSRACSMPGHFTLCLSATTMAPESSRQLSRIKWWSTRESRSRSHDNKGLNCGTDWARQPRAPRNHRGSLTCRI